MTENQDQPISAILEQIHNAIPGDFPTSCWYLIAGTLLAAIGRGDKFGDLFVFVIEKGGTNESEYRRRISKRFREIIIKSWTLIGMPRAIAASYSLQAVDKDGDDATDDHRRALTTDPDSVMRSSQDWFQQVFGKDESKIFARFSGHREMEWALRYAVYGIFLSDLNVVTPIENECIILASVLPCGGSPVLSHMAFLRRMGFSRDNAAFFHKICVQLAQWAGVDTTDWPTFQAAEHMV